MGTENEVSTPAASNKDLSQRARVLDNQSSYNQTQCLCITNNNSFKNILTLHAESDEIIDASYDARATTAFQAHLFPSPFL